MPGKSRDGSGRRIDGQALAPPCTSISAMKRLITAALTVTGFYFSLILFIAFIEPLKRVVILHLPLPVPAIL